MIEREHYYVEELDDSTAADNEQSAWQTTPAHQQPVSSDAANLISSRIVGTLGDLHAPVLDIDFTAALIPSSTPGHYHLYLDQPIEWKKYRALLIALADAGIISRWYADRCIEHRATYVRKWGARKVEKQRITETSTTSELP